MMKKRIKMENKSILVIIAVLAIFMMYQGQQKLAPGDTITKFRIADSTVHSETNSAIAWSKVQSCDGTTPLTRWGYYSSTCWSTTVTDCPSRSGYTLVINLEEGIPVDFRFVEPGKVCLYTSDSDSTRIALAMRQASSSGQCSLNGQWTVFYYDSDDNDNVNVEDSPVEVDITREISCEPIITTPYDYFMNAKDDYIQGGIDLSNLLSEGQVWLQ